MRVYVLCVQGWFLFFFCINVFLSCSMDTLSSGIQEKVDRFFCLFSVYKTLVQGRLASYTDTTKGALWSNCGFQIKLRKYSLVSKVSWLLPPSGSLLWWETQSNSASERKEWVRNVLYVLEHCHSSCLDLRCWVCQCTWLEMNRQIFTFQEKENHSWIEISFKQYSSTFLFFFFFLWHSLFKGSEN